MAEPRFIARTTTEIAPTTTGPWTITHPEFVARGITPDAVIVVASVVPSGTSGAIGSGWSSSWGCTDGTGEGVTHWWAEDNVATSVADSGYVNGSIIKIGGLNGEPVDLLVSFTSFSSGKVLLNVDTASADEDVSVTVIFLAGTELTAEYISGSANNSTDTITTVSDPDVVLACTRPFFKTNADTDEVSPHLYWNSTLGSASSATVIDDGGCSATVSDGEATGDGLSTFAVDRSAYFVETLGARSGIAYSRITTKTTTSIDFENFALPYDMAICGLSLNLGDVGWFMDDQEDIPRTTPAVVNYTKPAFFPEFIYGQKAYLNVADANTVTSVKSGLGIGAGYMFQSTRDIATHSYASEHGVATMDVNTMVDTDHFWKALFHDGRDLFEGDLTFNSDGFDIDFTDVSSVGYLWQYVTFERTSVWVPANFLTTVPVHNNATLQRKITGSGGATSPGCTPTGAGGETFTGTATATSPTCVPAAVGSVVLESAVTMSAPACEISSVGTETFSGTAVQVSPACSLTAVGAETFTGTAAQNSPICSIVAAGSVVNNIGTSAMVSPGCTLASAGVETFSGTASTTSPTCSLAAVGIETFNGTAVQVSPACATASVGTVVNNIGAVVLVSPTCSLAAAGTETFSGTATQTSPACAIAASGAETFTATTVMSAPACEIAAAGTNTVAGNDGTVAMSAPACEISSVGTETFSGAAVLVSPPCAISSTGTVANPITGTATMVSPGCSIAAVGSITGGGTVVMTSPGCSLDAVGSLVFSGSITAASPVCVLDVTGGEIFTAMAAMAAPSCDQNAAGALLFTASVEMVTPACDIFAVGVNGELLGCTTELLGTYILQTDLTGTHIAQTDLTGTHITQTDLEGNYLVSTELDGTYIDGTDLTGGIC